MDSMILSAATYVPLPSAFYFIEKPMQGALDYKCDTSLKGSVLIKNSKALIGFVSLCCSPVTLVADIIIGIAEIAFASLRGCSNSVLQSIALKKLVASPVQHLVFIAFLGKEVILPLMFFGIYVILFYLDGCLAVPVFLFGSLFLWAYESRRRFFNLDSVLIGLIGLIGSIWISAMSGFEKAQEYILFLPAWVRPYGFSISEILNSSLINETMGSLARIDLITKIKKLPVEERASVVALASSLINETMGSL